jgi:hypothetical protein
MEYRQSQIVDVIGELNRNIYLPAIQREFVWDTKRIEKLFDSIMSGYPIGSLLFWKVKEENKDQWTVYEFIRDYNAEDPHNEIANLKGVNKDIFLVLDGQQRLTAFNIGLRGSYRYRRYRWRVCKLYLNLLKAPVPEEEDPEELAYGFELRESENTDKGLDELWYPVGRILDFEDAEEAKEDIKQRIDKLPEEMKSTANKLIGRLHNRIHTAKTINFYEENTQYYDKVLNIFVRANSAGKMLEYSDLLLSTATAKWEHLDARKEVQEFTDDINDIGPKFNFGKDFVLKGCLYLTEDLPIRYKVSNFTSANLIKIENNWNDIKTYISTTVRLISTYGLSEKNLVSPLSILPISYFLMKKGSPNFDKLTDDIGLRIQGQIRDWLVIALLKNAFGSASDNKLKNIRDVLNTLDSFDSFPTQAINKELNIESSFSDAEIEDSLSYSYQGRYTFLLLSLLQPEAAWKPYAFHEDHIFPKSEFTTARLQNRGYDKAKIGEYQKYYNSVLNLQLLSDADNLAKSSMPYDEWIRSRDQKYRERNLIPEIEDYSMDSFLTFIDKRKALLYSRLKEKKY